MERLPEWIVVAIWELAGGRPVHPLAQLFKEHFALTLERLEGFPAFFESPGWDLVRACQMHRVVRSKPHAPAKTRRGRSKKDALPKWR